MPESSIPATIAAPAALYPVLTTLVTLIEASRPPANAPAAMPGCGRWRSVGCWPAVATP